MQGCRMRSAGPWFVLLVINVGCGPVPAEKPAEPVASAHALASHFNPASAGNIHGMVRWQGDIPTAPPFRAAGYPANGVFVSEHLVRANPNLPDIDPKTRAVRGAVVFLRPVDPGTARPWNLPPVQIVMRGLRLHVLQGEVDASIGFVHRGDRVTMVSQEKAFHVLWLRGAAFLSLPFPDPDQPLDRALTANGVVELSSGAGYLWTRGYLFVSDHPYFTRTDARGRFRLQGVPPGHYQVVCWMPHWKITANARDPETALVLRVTFAPPVETVTEADVHSGETVEAPLTVDEKAFR